MNVDTLDINSVTMDQVYLCTFAHESTNTALGGLQACLNFRVHVLVAPLFMVYLYDLCPASFQAGSHCDWLRCLGGVKHCSVPRS